MGDPCARKDYRVPVLGIVKQVQQILIIVYCVVFPYENFSLIRRRHRCKGPRVLRSHPKDHTSYSRLITSQSYCMATRVCPNKDSQSRDVQMLEKITYQIAYLLGIVMKILFEQQTSLIQMYRWFISLFLQIWTGGYQGYAGCSWILNTVVIRRVHIYFVPFD